MHIRTDSFSKIDLFNELQKYEFNETEKKAALSFLNKSQNYFDAFSSLDDQCRNSGLNDAHLKKKINSYLSNFITQAHKFDRTVKSHITRKKTRDLFRSIFGKYIFSSPIIKRSYDKPRGYPGDCFIFEMFYENQIAEQGLAHCLEWWIVNRSLAKDAIYRKNKIKKFITQLIDNNQRELSFLNIGCGSSREIRELISENKVDFSNTAFSFVDQDEEALKFSEESIRNLNPKIKTSFYQENILSIIGLSKLKNQFGKQDVIYSIGVADYFMRSTLENFIRFCYSLLKPKGKLIIPLCSSHNPKVYIPLTWFCEWHFYSHKPNEIINFIKKEIGIDNVRILWEKNRSIFFIFIEKQ